MNSICKCLENKSSSPPLFARALVVCHIWYACQRFTIPDILDLTSSNTYYNTWHINNISLLNSYREFHHRNNKFTKICNTCFLHQKLSRLLFLQRDNPQKLHIDKKNCWKALFIFLIHIKKKWSFLWSSDDHLLEAFKKQLFNHKGHSL